MSTILPENMYNPAHAEDLTLTEVSPSTVSPLTGAEGVYNRFATFVYNVNTNGLDDIHPENMYNPAHAEDCSLVEIDPSVIPPLTGREGVYPRYARLVYLLNGGSDSHNKGYFTDTDALSTAYPTAEAGDYAVVGSTDTIWVWNDDPEDPSKNGWVDTDTKGQISSIDGLTGSVKISGSEWVSVSSNGSDQIEIYIDDNKIDTTINSASPANDKIPTSQAVANYVDTYVDTLKVLSAPIEINIAPISAQEPTPITGALTKPARVVVTPSLSNIGAVYIKQSNIYSNLNPIYPDPTNNVYEFSDMSEVNVFVDNIGDNVDLVIAYRG